MHICRCALKGVFCLTFSRGLYPRYECLLIGCSNNQFLELGAFWSPRFFCLIFFFCIFCFCLIAFLALAIRLLVEFMIAKIHKEFCKMYLYTGVKCRYASRIQNLRSFINIRDNNRNLK